MGNTLTNLFQLAVGMYDLATQKRRYTEGYVRLLLKKWKTLRGEVFATFGEKTSSDGMDQILNDKRRRP